MTADHPTAHTSGSDDALGHDAAPVTGHGHAEPSEPLGPVDLVAWAYAVAGGAIGLLAALGLYVAAQS